MRRRSREIPRMRIVTMQMQGVFTRQKYARHPESPSMSQRFRQLANRGEGPCASLMATKRKIPRIGSRADEIARSAPTTRDDDCVGSPIVDSRASRFGIACDDKNLDVETRHAASRNVPILRKMRDCPRASAGGARGDTRNITHHHL